MSRWLSCKVSCHNFSSNPKPRSCLPPPCLDNPADGTIKSPPKVLNSTHKTKAHANAHQYYHQAAACTDTCPILLLSLFTIIQFKPELSQT